MSWPFIFVIVTSIIVYIDAKIIGVKKGLITGSGNINPWAWCLGSMLLWIVVFPFYLYKRSAFKKAIAEQKRG